MTNKKKNDEIDLLDLFITIWNKKLIVVNFLAVSLVVGFFLISQTPDKVKVSVTADIRPISIYDEVKYQTYKFFLEPEVSQRESSESLSVGSDLRKMEDEIFFITNQRFKKNFIIRDINKKFLYNLFIEKLKDQSNLEKLVEKFELINKENFINDQKSSKKVLKVEPSISLLINEDITAFQFEEYIVQFTGLEENNHEGKYWVNFLKFIEKEINLAIQIRLNEMFNNYMNYIETIIGFKIEDIDNQLSRALIAEEKIYLERKKSNLIQNKYMERAKNLFSELPISNSDEFFAAHIIYNEIKYDRDRKGTSKQKILLLSVLLGLILSMIYILISTAVQNRR
jgi:hypothetical protein